MESSRGVHAIDAGSTEGTTTSHAESSSNSARDGNSAGALGADGVEAPRHSSRAHKGHAVQLVLTALHASAPSEDAHSAAARLYKHALVDHFDETLGEERTWKQRYYVDARFWGGHGYPVFLYIGGEGPQGAPSPKLFMWTLAEKHKALMIALEHRFYGESRPTPDLSLGSLRLLSAAQALADIARFIGFVNAHEPKSTKSTERGAEEAAASEPPLDLEASTRHSRWIAFGGSYPGSLATWLKLKYPSLVVGVVGSSAPVFAEYDFGQYAQVVGAALANGQLGGSPSCVAVLQAGIEELVRVHGDSDLPQPLRPCTKIEDDLDRSAYYAEIFGYFQGLVQYNEEGRPPYVSDVCAAVAAAARKGPPIAALAAAVQLFSPNAARPRCVAASFREDVVGPLTRTKFSHKGCDLRCDSARQWAYQSCAEFGYFQTATAPNQPFHAFGTVLNVSTAGAAVCIGAFGLKSSYAGPRRDGRHTLSANADYGGRAILVANITMPTGSADPWHALGVVNATDAFYEVGGGAQRLGKHVSVVELDSASHCRDMFAPNAFSAGPSGRPDPAAVSWAHARVGADVARYLS